MVSTKLVQKRYFILYYYPKSKNYNFFNRYLYFTICLNRFQSLSTFHTGVCLNASPA